MVVFVATFDPPGERTQILGVFSTETQAELAIHIEITADKITNFGDAHRYEQNIKYYSIRHHTLDLTFSIDSNYFA